jgi:hypothetical protein
MFRVDTVGVSAFAMTGEDWLSIVEWLSEGRPVKLSLPRDTFRVPVFDDEGAPHLTIPTANSCLGVAESNLPDMPTARADCFVLFHRFTLSALLELRRSDNRYHRREVSSYEHISA